MTLADALIIYLALGAPVAMYQFFQVKRPISGGTAVSIVAVLLLWPFWAFKFLLPGRFDQRVNAHFVTREKLDVRIIENVETLKDSVMAVLATKKPTAETELFKENLEAYVEFSTVLALESDHSNRESEFLNISGHPDVQLGSLCLRRKNQLRLSGHKENVASRLGAMAHRLEIDNNAKKRISESLKQIAEIFGDNDLITLLEGRPSLRQAEIAETVVYA